MALIEGKYPVTTARWNHHVMTCRVSDTSDPGLNEARIFLVSGEFYWKVWNGSEWKTTNPLSASELLTLIKTVDGGSSGLNADMLDGEHGSSYHNASNLSSGTVPQARLSASDLLTLLITVDGTGSGLDADLLRGKNIQSGRSYGTTVGANITFDEAFSSTPDLAFAPEGNYSIWYGNLSTTGFKAYSTAVNYFRWFAIGE